MSDIDWNLISSYAGLLSLATVSIYLGAFGSLPNPKSKKATGDKDADTDNDDDEVTERMSSEDAYLFPLMGSAALLSLYMIVKYFGKEWINWLLGWYFSIMGIGSVSQSLISIAKYIVGRNRWKKFHKSSLVFGNGIILGYVTISWRTPTFILAPLGAIPSVAYTFSNGSRRSALLTDILAMSFSHSALSLLRIDSFKTGCILLTGLFLYDIWWVFGTEVMVKVATQLDVPIKLLWPKSLLFADTRGFTMLGLGDVVIPGTFVALALRYDYHRASKTAASKSYAKPYFYAALIAYVAGLVTTMTVMHVFGKAQPALLYLSPACISSFFVTAFLRSEIAAAWAWSDDPEPAINSSQGDVAATERESDSTAST